MRPHVICLNEVDMKYVSLCLGEDWIQSGYIVAGWLMAVVIVLVLLRLSSYSPLPLSSEIDYQHIGRRFGSWILSRVAFKRVYIEELDRKGRPSLIGVFGFVGMKLSLRCDQSLLTEH